jgi:DNA-directed RNA polymerase specialized sigma24 family protein
MPNAVCHESADTFTAWVTWALPKLEQYLFRRYGDRQLAAEAAGEAVSRLWEAWRADPDVFVSDRHMLNWCKRTGRCQAVDRLRWRNRHRPLPGGGSEGETGGRRPAVPRVRLLREPEAEERARDKVLLWECLERLPAADRDLLVGHFWEGRTDAEAGLPERPGSIQARGLWVWRRRHRLQRQLGRDLVAAGVNPSTWSPRRSSSWGVKEG